MINWPVIYLNDFLSIERKSTVNHYLLKKKNKNEDEDDIYIGEPDTFITGLIEEIKDPKYSMGGRTKNKKMKIRKNKSSKKTANSFKII